MPIKVSSPTATPTTVTTTPAPLSSPPCSSYPSVLVGRHPSNNSEFNKPKVPPPVPPRGTPKVKKSENYGKGDFQFEYSHGVSMHAHSKKEPMHEFADDHIKTRKKYHSFSARNMLHNIGHRRTYSQSLIRNRKGWFSYLIMKNTKTFPCTANYVVTKRKVLYYNPKYSDSSSWTASSSEQSSSNRLNRTSGNLNLCKSKSKTSDALFYFNREPWTGSLTKHVSVPSIQISSFCEQPPQYDVEDLV